jgi:RNA polymerase primary sigma factor
VLADFVVDENLPDMDEVAARIVLKGQVEGVLETLTPRERRVVELRFGLEGDKLYTLSEIGAELGVTRERIRQIETKALRKLRHPSRSKRLREFTD